MTAQIIDGKKIAATVRQEIKHTVQKREELGLSRPGLDVILVGDNPASATYVRHKQRACDEVGILSQRHDLPADTSQAELTALIESLNHRQQTHGILLQLPLPNTLDAGPLLSCIDPKKDVDGFHPFNVGQLVQRQPIMRPCTPYGIIQLLKTTDCDLSKSHAVIIGASNIVGRPMALECLLSKCTVTVCHRFTPSLQQHIHDADILIAAIGKPGVIKTEWIKPGAVVIDVGFNHLPDGKICGDIDFNSAVHRASWITPVPGGVGPMTVATLLQNTVHAAELHDA